jgi:hypothetical protein
LFSSVVMIFITLCTKLTEITSKACTLTFPLHLPTGRRGLQPVEVNTDNVKTYI